MIKINILNKENNNNIEDLSNKENNNDKKNNNNIEDSNNKENNNDKENNCNEINILKNKVKEYEILINDFKYKLELLKKDNLEKILRLNAELENSYKRNSSEIEKIYKFSLEKFFIDFLPVIDNLERTENELDSDNINVDIIKEGIKLTLKLLIQTINKFGISNIDDINVPFNPNYHQAILTIKNNDFNNNYVVKVMQKGYLLHERLIRPAMVQVAINEDKKNSK